MTVAAIKTKEDFCGILWSLALSDSLGFPARFMGIVVVAMRVDVSVSSAVHQPLG